MRILDFLQYSVSPWVRLLTCAVLGTALYLLYRWDPERSERDEEERQPYSEFSLEPLENDSAWEALSGDGISDSKSSEEKETTIIELERYLSSLRRHRIQDLDRV